jgi:hypothetical protein
VGPFAAAGALATSAANAPAVASRRNLRIELPLVDTLQLRYTGRRVEVPTSGRQICLARIAGDNERFRVLDSRPVDEEDESPFVGCYRLRRRRDTLTAAK